MKIREPFWGGFQSRCDSTIAHSAPETPIEVFERITDTCYLPANRMLLELLKAHPEFSVSFSLSGLAIEQMEYYKPELIESFKELVTTGKNESSRGIFPSAKTRWFSINS